MRIKAKRKNRIDIADSGALSDLAFLLIVFFIVIAVFNSSFGFTLALPRPDSSKIVNKEDLIKIKLEANGDLVYNEATYSIDVLSEKIVERRESRPEVIVLLQISADVEYQHVVNMVDMVRGLEIHNFSFTMVAQ